MSKELNILQAIEMPVGTEFRVVYKDSIKMAIKKTVLDKNRNFVAVSDGDLESTTHNFVTAKFIPIQKPVSFEEAICSNKRIKVVVPKELNYKYSNGITCLLNDSWNNEYKTAENILKMLAKHSKREFLIKECKWYIEEE